MGTNGPQLNAAQKAIIQQAINAHNQKHAGNKNMQIDGSDVFTIAKNDKGVITVQVDAYGYTKEGDINSISDGQYDLEFRFEDETFDSDKKYEFSTMDDSSDNIKNFVDERNRLEAKREQQHVEFNGTDDESYKNIAKINERFAGTVKFGDATNSAKGNPNVTLADIDTNIANLEAKIKMIEGAEINQDSDFLTQDEKDELAVSTNVKKETKELRKQIIADLKQAIKDLEDMKETLADEKADATKSLGKLNEKMEALDIDAKERLALYKGNGASAVGADWTNEDLIKADANSKTGKDVQGTYAMDKAEAFADPKTVSFDSSSLPPQFADPNGVAQKMTRAAAEKAIKDFNKDNPNAQIPLTDVAAITINPKTGDILIGLRDSQPKEGETKGHDGRYDYKVPGFYNPKSGVLNPDVAKVENYGFASTKGVNRLYDQLKTAVLGMQDLTGDDRKAQDKVINGLVDKLGIAGEDSEKIKDFMVKVLRDNNVVDPNV